MGRPPPHVGKNSQIIPYFFLNAFLMQDMNRHKFERNTVWDLVNGFEKKNVRFKYSVHIYRVSVWGELGVTTLICPNPHITISSSYIAHLIDGFLFSSIVCYSFCCSRNSLFRATWENLSVRAIWKMGKHCNILLTICGTCNESFETDFQQQERASFFLSYC